MRVMCLPVALFAMLLMLGVPKDLHGPRGRGPHGHGRSVGPQKAQWCERQAKSSGLRQSLQTWRHSHRRRDECTAASHSEYRSCNTTEASHKPWVVSPRRCVFVPKSGPVRKRSALCAAMGCFYFLHLLVFVLKPPVGAAAVSTAPEICHLLFRCWSDSGCKGRQRQSLYAIYEATSLQSAIYFLYLCLPHLKDQVEAHS